MRPERIAASKSVQESKRKAATQRLLLPYALAIIGLVLVAFGWLADGTQGPARVATPPPLARIHVHGNRLYAGSVPWRAWGFNWGVGDHDPVLDYFDNPTSARLAQLRNELRTARRLGANSMRIPIELDQVMRGPTQARPTILAALRKLLAIAASERVYLDITGNVQWRPWHVSGWYERLSEAARWQVQANFWRAVAHAAAASPAVLGYELTSEPMVNEHAGTNYDGAYGGHTFIQAIATLNGRSGRAVARAWTKKLAAAVRSQDNRPITIGLLPQLHDSFTPANVADLLDVLVIHAYPLTGQAQASIGLVKGYARYHKPVIVGETFPILADAATERAFLVGAAPYTVGAFEFFDGRDPNHMTVSSIPDALYKVGLRQFIALRPILLKPRQRAVQPPPSKPSPVGAGTNRWQPSTSERLSRDTNTLY